MSVSPKSPVPQKQTRAIGGSDAAPVIYFDGVVAYGVNNGTLQLELATNCLVPSDINPQSVRTRILMVAHLRSSRLAAEQLAQAIIKALELDNPTKAEPKN